MKIGVLGGIGPEATGNFYLQLVKTLQDEGYIKSNCDFPQIVVNSIPAPELISREIKDCDLQHYYNGLKELDEMGLDIIVMVCNTIHLFFDVLQESIRTPILNLREEVHKVLQQNEISCITVLGTPSTITQGLYNFPEIRNIDPTTEELTMLGDTILNYNRGVQQKEQVEKTKVLVEKYLQKGKQIYVCGKIRTDAWQDQGGNQRQK